MVTIQVRRTVKLPFDKSILVDAAQLTLDEIRPSIEYDMTIVVGDDSLLKKLNSKYLGKDASTDVLSFMADEPDPDTRFVYLGDIIISLPRAEEQASAGGHPVEEEMQLLVAHGTLHLLGYDHITQADKKKMQVLQEKILQQLGVNLKDTL